MVTLPDQSHPLPPPPDIPRRKSLVSQTVESLSAHLQVGHWTQHLPAERELCQQLQVSRPTVRAALHELERRGFLEWIGRARRPTAAARRRCGRGAPSRVVTVLAPFPIQAMPQSALFVLDTLRDKLAKIAYALDVHADAVCFSSRPGRALEQLVQARPVAAWVAWGSKEPMQRWFVQRHLPLLVIGSCRPDIPLPSIDMDFSATCRHAVDLLWRKGHRRLGLVLQQDVYGGDIDSEQGFREALDHHPDVQWRVLRHDGTPAHLCSLLDRTLRSPAPPTGYLVVRALHALTVVTHLMRRKLRVPEDAAVISRDDASYFPHTSPVVSRYAVNPHQLARKVCKTVRELLESGTLAPKAIRLIPTLMPGETV